MKSAIYCKVLPGLLLCLLNRHSFGQSTTITPGGASLDNNNTQKSFNLPRLTYDKMGITLKDTLNKVNVTESSQRNLNLTI